MTATWGGHFAGQAVTRQGTAVWDSLLAEAGGVRNWVEHGHALELGRWLSRIALGTCRAQGTGHTLGSCVQGPYSSSRVRVRPGL